MDLPELAEVFRVRGADVLGRLDLQRQQPLRLLEDEVHLLSGAQPPVVQRLSGGGISPHVHVLMAVDSQYKGNRLWKIPTP